MKATEEGLGRRPKGPRPGLAALALLLTALLSGCAGSGGRDGPGDRSGAASIPDAVPKVEPRSKYGNPKSYVVHGKRYKTKKSSVGHVERGLASWYGKKFHGRKTSSGERYDMYAMTAAHKSLPLPTYAKVTNLENGRSAVVRINDRGPFHGNRVIDLSYSAARKLGVVRKGTAMVEVRAIDPRRPETGGDEGNLFADVGGTPQGTGAGRTASSSRKTAPAPARKPALVAENRPPAREKRETDREPIQPAVTEPEPMVAAVPAKVGPSSASAHYLQVGAFGNRNNAEQLRRQLGDALADQVLVRTHAGDAAPLYKVHVGPFESRLKARRASQQIASLGLKDFHVVTE